jgi:hypothetical protein
MRSIIAFAAAGLVLGTVAAPALAQPSANARRTIFLERGPGSGSTPAGVAYHPTWERYYASNAGNAGFSAWVYDSDGNRIQDLAALGIDARGWNYNPSTDLLEVSAFNAAANGLHEAVLDGSGFLTGAANLLLPTLAVAGSQSMPALDAGRNVLYSRENGAAVNVIRRADGSLASSFNLDLASAGVAAGDLTSFAIGYDGASDWVIAADHVRDQALVFDTAGAYIGRSQLDVDVPTSFRMAFANGQLFVFDAGRNGWQGFDIGDSPVCYPDCDGNEVLDFFDFLCFQNAFLAGDPYADCDGNGVLDFFDFLCFQNEFLAGCP